MSSLPGPKRIRCCDGGAAEIAAIYSHRTEFYGFSLGRLARPTMPAFIWRCPLCRKGIPLDAAVNSFGCSKA